MDDTLRRGGWILLIIIGCAYGTYLWASSTFNTPPPLSTPMVVRDLVRKNEHHLSGSVNVSESCEQITATSKQISSTVYEIVFDTWADPAVKCLREPTPRSFDLVVFAPSIGVHFTASLEDNPLNIAVYPIMDK